MEGNDFDFYKSNRNITTSAPVPDDHVIIIEVPPSGPPQVDAPKPPSVFKRHKVLFITAGICLCILIGVLSLALLGAVIEKNSLTVSINYGGHQSGDTLYVDTDNIELSISNNGKETVEGSKLYFKVSGSNVIKERINYTGRDIGPGERLSFRVQVHLVNESGPFTLYVQMFYNGKLRDSDSIPR